MIESLNSSPTDTGMTNLPELPKAGILGILDTEEHLQNHQDRGTF